MAHTVSGASLDGIYERLNGVESYHPLDADTFADWSVEAGDVVTISREGNNSQNPVSQRGNGNSGNENSSYQSPVGTSTIKWKGTTPTVSINSSGSEERDAVAKVSKNKFSSSGSGLTNSRKIYGDVWSEDGHVHSFVNQTASKIYMYVDDTYAQMRSGLELTSSSAALYVSNAYSQMTSGLALTSSSAALYVSNAYSQMTSGLALTSSSAALYVSNAYSQMTSGLALTSSSAALYVSNAYSQMTSGLALTSSSAALYVSNAYSQMTSGLALTSSSAALYVSNAYSQMTSGLALTSSSAALYVNSMYDQMTSGLKLTSSSAVLYVSNAYAKMTSGLELTSSSAALYVQSMYNQMKTGIEITSSSAALYAKNRTTRAYIVARINADGEGEALIEADKVKISGTTTINNVFTVISNAVGVKVPLICQGNVDISSNKVLNLYTATFQGTNPISLTALTLAKTIKEASVSGNTLTLTQYDGSTITFSKASTHSIEATTGYAVPIGSGLGGLAYAMDTNENNLVRLYPSTDLQSSYYYGIKIKCGDKTKYYYVKTAA